MKLENVTVRCHTFGGVDRRPIYNVPRIIDWNVRELLLMGDIIDGEKGENYG